MTYLEMLMNALKTERPRASGTRQSPYGSMPSNSFLPEFRAEVPANLQSYTQGYGLKQSTPSAPASSAAAAPQSLDYSYPPEMYQMPKVDVPAPMASNAGPARPPMPPPRPMMAQPEAPAPMPPVRPEGLGFNDIGRTIQGYNPYAMGAGPNAEAFAAQFAGGDLSKLGARTMRDEDGNTWNDYYVR